MPSLQQTLILVLLLQLTQSCDGMKEGTKPSMMRREENVTVDAIGSPPAVNHMAGVDEHLVQIGSQGALKNAGEGAEAPTMTCEDTPGWSNGHKHGCASYEEWCSNGGAKPGKQWTLGSKFKFPEKNCCVCGKVTQVPLLSSTKCTEGQLNTINECSMSSSNCQKVASGGSCSLWDLGLCGSQVLWCYRKVQVFEGGQWHFVTDCHTQCSICLAATYHKCNKVFPSWGWLELNASRSIEGNMDQEDKLNETMVMMNLNDSEGNMEMMSARGTQDAEGNMENAQQGQGGAGSLDESLSGKRTCGSR